MAASDSTPLLGFADATALLVSLTEVLGFTIEWWYEGDRLVLSAVEISGCCPTRYVVRCAAPRSARALHKAARTLAETVAAHVERCDP